MTSFNFFQKNIRPMPLIYPKKNDIEINQFTNILLIDIQVPSYQTFVDSVNSSTFPIVYSIRSSKTELLTLLQKMFTSISRISICFTSFLEKNIIFMDSKPLFLNNEQPPYSENLEFIINIIKEFSVKNIDYLACNTLNYSNWNNYYRLLSENTGVKVGASNDKTGNIKYGGDWIMESSSQDIEIIYFTKNIKYYQYLLDNPTWVNQGLDGPVGIAIDNTNTYVYVININDNTINKISILDPTNNITWANATQGLNTPSGIAIDNTNTYIYVINSGNNTISKISISDPNNYDANWANTTQGLDIPSGIVIDNTNTYIYVINSGNNTINQISISDPNNYDANWANATQGLDSPSSIAIDKTNTYIYVANYNSDTISQINISNPTIYNANWAGSTQGLLSVFGLAIDKMNTYMYAVNYDSNTISQINILDPTIYNATYANSTQGLNGPYGIVIDKNNTYMYVTNYFINTISQISLPYVCFKEDTKILTNKGYISVQNLRKGDLIKTLKHDYKPINMIGKREIYHIASKDRIKDQLYKYSPNEYPELFEPLIITGCHCVLVDNFVNEEQKEKTIKMNGKIYITDNKYRLPACADEKASVYEISGNYTIYHFALENDNYYMNYGIFANGLLVETCSKRYLKELSNMTLIE
jgi:DNA-binding beta-propeller fold protein YncE